MMFDKVIFGEYVKIDQNGAIVEVIIPGIKKEHLSCQIKNYSSVIIKYKKKVIFEEEYYSEIKTIDAKLNLGVLSLDISFVPTKTKKTIIEEIEIK